MKFSPGFGVLFNEWFSIRLVRCCHYTSTSFRHCSSCPSLISILHLFTSSFTVHFAKTYFCINYLVGIFCWQFCSVFHSGWVSESSDDWFSCSQTVKFNFYFAICLHTWTCLTDVLYLEMVPRMSPGLFTLELLLHMKGLDIYKNSSTTNFETSPMLPFRHRTDLQWVIKFVKMCFIITGVLHQSSKRTYPAGHGCLASWFQGL